MTQQKQSTGNAVQAVINVVVSLAIGVGGWFAAPAILAFLEANAPAVNQLAVSDATLRIIITVIVFLLGLMLTALVVTAVMPKDSRTANEKQIARQQEQQFAERRKKQGRKGARKRRKR